MIYPFLILLLVPLAALIFIGYQRPASLEAPSFPFTRKCLGVAISAYAVSIVGMQVAGMTDAIPILVFIARIIAWVFLIFTLRGVFEILAGK